MSRGRQTGSNPATTGSKRPLANDSCLVVVAASPCLIVRPSQAPRGPLTQTGTGTSIVEGQGVTDGSCGRWSGVSYGELADQEWALLEPLLPQVQPQRGGRWRDHRQVVEGMVFKERTSCPWRELPE
ncbi:hypothetical protein CDG81_06340 [Actinopolyspora erythraea]|uniref:Insertion element IS402-like domain-containing protein n=1 Tax=Actinopolyspora erythraea TaxID=414996 RepID=A0A223RQ64_9ACTN|nr:hypothetical protein CDG81_06340 [Actinopolyspora erythraea]